MTTGRVLGRVAGSVVGSVVGRVDGKFAGFVLGRLSSGPGLLVGQVTGRSWQALSPQVNPAVSL